jgi:protein tyrosine phosphatase (PTP) superfamily phosphohydrolase (DUF442 family)
MSWHSRCPDNDAGRRGAGSALRAGQARVRERRCWHWVAGLICLVQVAFGCPPQLATGPASAQSDLRVRQPVAGDAPHPLAAVHLANVWRIHPKVISGGLPKSEAAFQELAALGVRTIISVDGAKPDIALAGKCGLRYVHLPHGYDGVPEHRAHELAKAVRDLPGAIYIHCHHGRHRSPAAAAVACVGAGFVEPAGAETILAAAGTSRSYQGLYQSALAARRLDDRLLDEMRPEFPESAKLPRLAEAMVQVEHTYEDLRQAAAAGWKSPPAHPDIEPAHEALLLREQFTELLRSAEVRREPELFRAWMRDSQSAAQALENAIRGWKSAGMTEPPPAEAGKLLDRITANCRACHVAYRDVPLRDKARAR